MRPQTSIPDRFGQPNQHLLSDRYPGAAEIEVIAGLDKGHHRIPFRGFICLGRMRNTANHFSHCRPVARIAHIQKSVMPRPPSFHQRNGRKRITPKRTEPETHKAPSTNEKTVQRPWQSRKGPCINNTTTWEPWSKSRSGWRKADSQPAKSARNLPLDP